MNNDISCASVQVILSARAIVDMWNDKWVERSRKKICQNPEFMPNRYVSPPKKSHQFRRLLAGSSNVRVPSVDCASNLMRDLAAFRLYSTTPKRPKICRTIKIGKYEKPQCIRLPTLLAFRERRCRITLMLMHPSVMVGLRRRPTRTQNY